MTDVEEIVDAVLFESAKSSLDSDAGRNAIIRWMNNYKLELQRKRRWYANQTTAVVGIEYEHRTIDLPTDYLSLIDFRRMGASKVVAAIDFSGMVVDQVQLSKLTRWTNEGKFREKYPDLTDEGLPIKGISNDYIVFRDYIMMSKYHPNIDGETFILEYYRLLPKYGLQDIPEENVVSSDWLSRRFSDGLQYKAMEEIYTSYEPDEQNRIKWQQRVLQAEASLNHLQIIDEVMFNEDLSMETFG